MSYLNTVPLVWGFLHGPQQGTIDLRFELPARCADSLRTGTADIGLVPLIEAARQCLNVLPGLGIASEGQVRSILLICKTPIGQIRSLALDESSRTSVVLAKVILAEKWGVRPAMTNGQASLPARLERSDAALVIGDPALRYNAGTSGYEVYDLGREWSEWTGLPMVYAVWAGQRGEDFAELGTTFHASYEFGRDHLDDIVRAESAARGVAEALSREYLTRHIVYELGPRHVEGIQRFLHFAQEMNELQAV